MELCGLYIDNTCKLKKESYSVASVIYFWSSNRQTDNDRHHSLGLAQSTKTSLLTLTSGKTSYCSQKKIPHTISLRETEKERRDEIELRKKWEGM